MNWLAHFFGLDNLSGPWYGFWSGVGSDIAELAIIGGLITMVRQHNCEVHKCWRLGRHKTAAGHRACRRHHPDGHLTHERLLRAHREATAKEG